jgi:SAM-dependent methyltransferase
MNMERDFSEVSESPNLGVSQENANMLATRYAFARRFAEGKETLEVACGAGMGLGYLAEKAKVVVGGDYDPRFVEMAKKHYGDRIVVDEIDAQDLPYADQSFDCVILMEAIYFLSDAKKFIDEAKRVLRPGGSLVIVSANCEWKLFNPSDRATRYFSVRELKAMLESAGFGVEAFCGFKDRKKGIRGKLLGLARKIVVALRLIPNTMKGKELMKRLAYGKLVVLPNEIMEGFAPIENLESYTGTQSISMHKVIYIVGNHPQGTDK